MFAVCNWHRDMSDHVTEVNLPLEIFCLSIIVFFVKFLSSRFLAVKSRFSQIFGEGSDLCRGEATCFISLFCIDGESFSWETLDSDDGGGGSGITFAKRKC